MQPKDDLKDKMRFELEQLVYEKKRAELEQKNSRLDLAA